MDPPQQLRTVSELVSSPGTSFLVQLPHKSYQLRLLQLADAPALYAVINANRAHLRQWLPWLDHTRSPDDSQAFIQETQQKLHDNQALTLAICQSTGQPKNISEESQGIGASNEALGGAIAGLISLDPIDWCSRSAYMGYWLAEKHQGQGLMTQACQALIDYSFSTLALQRIVIACATENHRSRAIPERLGFLYDGRIRQAEWLYNRYVDHQVYVKFCNE